MSKPRLKPHPDKKYRLITRSDMDGLVCAVLLKELGIIDDILFAHPKDMQDGLIDVGPDDITTNLPYHPDAWLVIDHHASEAERVKGSPDNHIIKPDAPSAARVVYDYFGGAAAFPTIEDAMMTAVDKADSAAFSREDILNPTGWDLLSFIMDARTGLGRFRDFNISNYQLMMKLIDACQEHKSIAAIMALPDVRERVDLYNEQKMKFREQVDRCGKLHGKLLVVDLRNEQTIFAGNRFMVYALHPECSLSMHIVWGKNKQNTVVAMGKSILDRSSKVHVGQLMLEYGGGGHDAAGTCQLNNLHADQKIAELIKRVSA